MKNTLLYTSYLACSLILPLCSMQTSSQEPMLVDSQETHPPIRSSQDIAQITKEILALDDITCKVATSTGYKTFTGHQHKAAEYATILARHIARLIPESNLTQSLAEQRTRGFKNQTKDTRIAFAVRQKFIHISTWLPSLKKMLPDKPSTVTLLRQLSAFGADAFEISRSIQEKKPRFFDELTSQVPFLLTPKPVKRPYAATSHGQSSKRRRIVPLPAGQRRIVEYYPSAPK